jgi:hypothetical protein
MVFMVTFIIVATQYRNASISSAQTNLAKEDPRRILDHVAYDLFRDTNDERSALRWHSLLRDMYGSDGFRAVIKIGKDRNGLSAAVTEPLLATGGQFVEFEIDPLLGLSTMSGYYNGCLLTPISGAAKGCAMRVVYYEYNATGSTFRTYLPTGDGASVPGLAVGDSVWVNGRPFSGQGFGFNPTTGKSDMMDYGADGVPGRAADALQDGNDDGQNGVDDAGEWLWPGSDDGWACLMPNRVGEALPVGYAQGGGDESYDAADYQNMALAAVAYDRTANVSSPSFIEPSFHRAALVDFWFRHVSKTWLADAVAPEFHVRVFLQPFGPDNRPNTGDEVPFTDPKYEYLRRQIALLKERIMIRPSADRNPDFSGGNEAYYAAALTQLGLAYQAQYLAGTNPNPALFMPYCIGPWDVDNDNDGTRDSVWIDPGMPVVTDRDGRLAKPLVAILCMDLDNRLNVNAHGTLAHFSAFRTAMGWNFLGPNQLALQNPATWNTVLANMPQGLGYGPPEIDLRAILGTQAARILAGDPGPPVIAGRYGSDQRPGVGLPNSLDKVAQIKFFDYPTNYFNASYQAAFQSPPDLLVEQQVGLDYRGQPNYVTADPARTSLIADSPYEIDLSRTGNDTVGKDMPFATAELERLLRDHDRDAQLLPSRILDLAGTAILGQPERELNRQALTTDSYDVPVPNVVRPRDWVGVPPRTAADLIRARVEPAMTALGWNLTIPAVRSTFESRMSNELAGAVNSLGIAPNTVRVSLSKGLLATDLLMGVRMDVNRPFGNGLDDNANLIVDEHWQNPGGRVTTQAVGPTTVLDPLPWAFNESGDWGNNSTNPGFRYESIWLNTIPTNLDNDGQVTSDPNDVDRDRDEFLARQIYARHLYILMMALKPTSFHFNYDGNNGTPQQENEEDARILAQWAINVVDFRDADSIMTPFEYDVTPFQPHPGIDGAWGRASFDDDGLNGADDIGEALYPGTDDCLWCVDGIIGTAAAPSDDDTNPLYQNRRRLVWGSERPELLLTEAFAFHDRRTEDLATPGGRTTDAPPNNDPHFDQRLRPRGGFFVELYNPWASSVERRPAEFDAIYNNGAPAWQWPNNDANNANKIGVVLNKKSGLNAAMDTPIWRLIVTPYSATDDPDDSYPNGVPANTVRAVYFTAGGPPIPAPGRTYTAGYAAANTPSLALALKPGRYAVVGTLRDVLAGLIDPADGSTTYTAGVCNLGRRADAVEGTDLMKASTRRIVLRDGWDTSNNRYDPDLGRVYVEQNGDVLLPKPWYPTNPPANYVADIQPPIGLPVTNLEITEDAYTATNWVPPAGPEEEGQYTPPIDEPFDENDPLLSIDGVKPNFRTVHLQRLANPLLPYDPATNPYLTVDSLPVDLEVFNGVTSDPDPKNPGGAVAPIESRERGTGATRTLWVQDSNNTSDNVDDADFSVDTATVIHYYKPVLLHTLGFLNEPFDPLADHDSDGNTPMRRTRFVWDYTLADPTLNMLRVPFRHGVPPDPTTALQEFVGAPNTRYGNPFPWLTWLNRPYVSAPEMVLVPRARSSKLLASYNLTPSATTSAYDPGYNPDDPAEKTIFSHLMPIFGTSIINPAAPADYGADLYKIFDLLHVPSRFVGAETWLEGSLFKQVGLAPGPGTEFFHPPFNRLSNYRDPGKININTIYDDRVWKAIQGNLDLTTEAASFFDLIDTRRGFGTAGSPMISFNGAPTFFANPLRSADAGGMVPFTQESLTQLTNVILLEQANTGRPQPLLDSAYINGMFMERANNECTLLRSSQIAPNGGVPPFPAVGTPPRFLAKAAGQFLMPHEDISRNPYFSVGPLHRLANLVTTRSNVYAVWITVGYFEVNPLNMQLEDEIGWDTGSIRRHRAFYIFDRSIPVAFEPGKNHNIDRAILLRRLVE